MQTLVTSPGTPVASTAGAAPNPARIIDTLLYSHARADALKAAIDLELFSELAAGARTFERLAETCKASKRGIRALCDFLVVNGFLTKSNGEYELAPDARAFLDRRSPHYIGSVAQFMAGRHNAAKSATILECVRTGHATLDVSGVEDWVTFAESMVPLARLVANAAAEIVGAEKAGPIRVLDVAAGHGEFGLAIARRNPLAHIVGQDFSDVVAVARRRADEAGVGERYSVLEGDAFDIDLGGPYDIVLLPNFLHFFEVDRVERFLRKVDGVVKRGGRIVTVEFVPNEDRISPPAPAMFSLTILMHANGEAYTFAELDDMLRRAGWAKNRAYPVPPTPQTIVVSERTE